MYRLPTSKQKHALVFSAIGLFLLLVVLLLALAMYFASSFGWFAQSTQADAQDLGSHLTEDTGAEIREFHVYKRDGLTHGAAEVSNSIPGDPLYYQQVSLTEYDTVFTDRNVDTPMIFKVIIDHVNTNFAGLTVTVTCPENTTNYLDEDNNLGNFLSNICAIRCGYGTAELNAETDPDEIYSGAVALLENSQPGSFASVNAQYQNTGKVNELTFTLGQYTAQNDTITVYLELSYNAELVDAYITQNGIEITSQSTAGNDIQDFVNDLSEFKFTYQ